MNPYLGGGWWLDFHDSSHPFVICPEFSDLDPAVMGRQNGAVDGTPLFVAPDGRADPRINRFWRDPSTQKLSVESMRRYAFSLKVWLNFLHAIGTNWDRADPSTLADFKEWRMSAGLASTHVSSNTFHLDLAALMRFYQWASTNCVGVSNPVRFRQVRRAPAGQLDSILDARPSGVRRADVKWLTPSAFRQWRNIGLRGFTAEGVPSSSWIGSVEDRDVAFVNGLFGTGLRCGEWSSLLTIEVPEQHNQRRLLKVWLADACAKRGRGRHYWLPLPVIKEVQFYIREGSRSEAILRAQHDGRYASIRDLLLVESVDARGILSIRDGNQLRRMNLSALDPRLRMRLFKKTDSGLEPLWVWLNTNGMPRPKTAWSKTFTVANERVDRELSSNSHKPTALWARPHMLRHSFALRWYSIATFVAWNRTAGLTVTEQRDFRNQLGDVWFLLATLLGHRSTETTRNVYLEPFQSLQIDNIVAMMDSEDRTALERLVDVVGDENSRVLGAFRL